MWPAARPAGLLWGEVDSLLIQVFAHPPPPPLSLPSLVSSTILTSLFGQIFLQTAFQTGALLLIRSQDWFVPLKPKPDSNNIMSYENTVWRGWGRIVVALVRRAN